MDFVVFKKGKQKEFLMKVKNKSNLSWPNLSKTINKSRSTLLAYQREDCKMPQEIVNILISTYNIPIKDIQIISLNNTKREITFPKTSNNLSEFIGALSGDGHLHLKPAELSIAGHAKLDKEYFLYLIELFEKLFNQKPTIIYQKNTIKLRFYSKDLVLWLNEIYFFPIGKKKNKLKIPLKIKNKKNYLISFIRGIFDTDGTFTRHHKNSGAIIEIISRDIPFLKEINEKLEELGFKTSLGYKGVKIYRKTEINKFFEIIQPSNPKHLKKYKIFKRKGFVPLTQAPMV